MRLTLGTWKTMTSSMSNEGVSIGLGRCSRETARAVLIYLTEEKEEIWIPQSVIHDDSEVWKEDDEGDVVVAEWWARSEGLT